VRNLIRHPWFLCFLLIGLFATSGWAQTPPVNRGNWGTVTSPVFGTSESAPYAGAELFAGPNKFGSYFSGVLPNGSIVRPAGTTIQIGMNPLGAALTPDGRFLVTSNDDEREGGFASFQSPGTNVGGYTLSVVDTSTMVVVSKITTGKFFVGLQITGTAPTYTAWVSGGPDNDVKIYNLTAGVLTPGTPAHIVIAPITPGAAGFVSNYTPDAALNTAVMGNKPPVPSSFSRTGTTQITFPAGSALSPDGRYLYVACNGDNSVAVIDTNLKSVVRQVAVGYFPYSVSVSADGQKVLVSNWGVTEYKFAHPTYDAGTGKLTAIGTTGTNLPDGFYVPVTSTSGNNPKTSSVSLLSAPGGNGSQLALQGSFYEGHPLDELYNVGDTHPNATAIVRRNGIEVLYVAKANSDSVGLISLNGNQNLNDFDLSLSQFRLNDDQHHVHGTYPNAIAVSPSGDRVYVAEAGLNSVAVLNTSNPTQPMLVGRIPTDWYPTGLAISSDGQTLYVLNAKGIGEDINPANGKLISTPSTDSNYIFGSLQKVNVSSNPLNNTDVLKNNFAVQARPKGPQVVPVGGDASEKIKHVFFILHENKTFDSMLGNQTGHFGPFASTTFSNADGSSYVNGQYTGVSVNTQLLATTFAAAGNYYSDSEESDAGHQFAASGTATDYTEKTLLVKSGRGLLVNKNFEPEDYPESGYIFNNAARNGVSFKDYGALVRIEGTDTGTSTPTSLNDPPSGNYGLPVLKADNFSVTNPLQNIGDVTTHTQGLGQSYFISLPILSILGGSNASGEARLDRNYPGYNFNISDQRRAQEFIRDFDRMVASDTLPQFIYIYQPNDHTGGVQAPNANLLTNSPLQEIADGDVALGMVVRHIMQSSVYFDPATYTGSAIFMTYDDAQSSLDHIHPHRTPLLVVSPFAKPGYIGLKHYVTASVVKTEELLLGLPPNNLGDLFATDLRDLFQNQYNGIKASGLNFQTAVNYRPSDEGMKIWSLVWKLDTSAPDRDSRRLGMLARLCLQADQLHDTAAKQNRLKTRTYRNSQKELYNAALRVVNGPQPRDNDD
jgi:YVTN family beta-propeller protein